MTPDTHCIRCKRPVSEVSREFVDWEVGPDGAVCAGCLTGEDQAAIDADALDMTSKAAIERAMLGVDAESIDDEDWGEG